MLIIVMMMMMIIIMIIIIIKEIYFSYKNLFSVKYTRTIEV